jgi:GWxTD domain-containing protein
MTMRTIVLTLTLFCLAIILRAQVLDNINYTFHYDQNNLPFEMSAVRSANTWTIFYRLQSKDTSKTINEFTIDWERRTSLSDKVGEPLSSELINPTTIHSEDYKLIGKITLPSSNALQIIVAKITDHSTRQLLIYFKTLDPNYPVNAYLKTVSNEPILEPYINKGTLVSIQGFASNDLLTVYYYNDFFPTAAPAFSEGQAKVSKSLKADSVFRTSPDELLNFKSIGLYLVQKDTNSTEGFAFRVEVPGYPKFRRVQDLVGPFIYICTKEEFQRLRMTGSDKKEFDREVLKISGDRERAQDLMRYFFQRVEVANQFFTSYKEGWKTDRGMMLIIYGMPEKIFKFNDREVWMYGKTNFNFVKSSTLFDPDNYVLVRDKKFTADWYEKVDMVRNSHF